MLSLALVQIREALAQVPFITQIHSQEDYDSAQANVSKLLNAADGKKLTRQHIEALSKRFSLSPALFF
ncbi:TPA: hypothetical protein ACSCYS_004538 [Aeromonas veronii]|nr:hypothetical protein [Aeromonas veronii]